MKYSPQASEIRSHKKPITKKILKILLPTTFPIAMAELPFLAATIEVASSGRDVPAATKVKPTTVSLTPHTERNLCSRIHK